MKKRTLENWFVRVVQGRGQGAPVCDRIELTHKGADDVEPRIVRTYDLAGAERDRLSEIAGEILADAADETNLAEVRCTFVVAAMIDDKAHATVKLRLDPVRDDGTVDQDALDEPSKAGVTAMVMSQNRALANALLHATSPARQREATDFVLDVLRDELKNQRAENEKLRAENAALRAELAGGDVTVEAIQKVHEDQALTRGLVGDIAAMIEHAQAFRARAAAGSNGHDAAAAAAAAAADVPPAVPPPEGAPS